jgi:hypothetical protein
MFISIRNSLCWHVVFCCLLHSVVIDWGCEGGCPSQPMPSSRLHSVSMSALLGRGGGATAMDPRRAQGNYRIVWARQLEHKWLQLAIIRGTLWQAQTLIQITFHLFVKFRSCWPEAFIFTMLLLMSEHLEDFDFDVVPVRMVQNGGEHAIN